MSLVFDSFVIPRTCPSNLVNRTRQRSTGTGEKAGERVVCVRGGRRPAMVVERSGPLREDAMFRVIWNLFVLGAGPELDPNG